MKKLFLATLLSLPVLNADAAEVYVVHGIPGADLNLDPTLPVDISVDGGCLLTNVTFGGIAGPVSVATGKHEIEVRVTDGSCTGTLAVTGRVDLALGETAIIIAHLDQNGAPKLTKFTAKQGMLGEGIARIAVVRFSTPQLAWVGAHMPGTRRR